MLVLRPAADGQNEVFQLDGRHTAPAPGVDLGA
jgi:hypothetical protein